MSHLANANTNLLSLDLEYSELNALFIYITTLVDINPDLIKRIIAGYKANKWSSKILFQVEDKKALADDKTILSFIKRIPMPMDSDLYFTPRPELPHPISRKVSQRSNFSGRAELDLLVGTAKTSSTFYLKSTSNRDSPPLEYPEARVETVTPADKRELFYHLDKLTGVHRLCISFLVSTEIITLIYIAGHSQFSRYLKIITRFWFIQGLTQLLQSYIRQCPQCLALQKRRPTPMTFFS